MSSPPTALTGLRRALAGLALAGVVASALAAAVTLSSDREQHPVAVAALGVLISWSFIGTGLYAWWRRPANRFGALMTLTGFLWLLSSLVESDGRLLYTIGLLFSSVYFAAFAHMVLAYPDGRLSNAFLKRLVAGGYVLSLLGPLPFALIESDELEACDCPASLLLISEDQGLLRVLDATTTVVAVGFVALAVSILVERWRRASAPRRRALGPVLWSGATLLVLLAGGLTSQTFGARDLSNVLMLAGLVAFASTPWAFSFGLLRSRVVRAAAVSDFLRRMGEAPGVGRLRDLLADALSDRSLQLVFWLEDREHWVDDRGLPVELPPADDRARAWTPVELEGHRVGAIIHDRSLRDERELVQSVAAAAGLAVERERLQAQLRARVGELQESRARLIEVSMAERRRLERNLHDGAQQRLVALALTLRLAQARVHKDPHATEELLRGAHEELTLALAELRELARGIHPAVLSDRGLDAALEALAGRSPVPVQIAETPAERLPGPVEAAAYYVVAEALTNVVKYADASRATIRVRRQNGTAVVEVDDDGRGGADPELGSGLQGLADRIAILDGRLHLHSPPGEGTHLRADIPL